jgi:hypothetical protein
LVSIGCTGFSPNASIIYDQRDDKVVCANAKWTQFQHGCGPPDIQRGFDALHPRRGNVGLYFDRSTWTGLDMFKPMKCSRVVVTDRIAKAIQGAGLHGYQVVPTEEYGRDLVDAIKNAGLPTGKSSPPRG